MIDESERLALADRIEQANCIEIVDHDLIDRNFSEDEKNLIIAALRRIATRATLEREALESIAAWRTVNISGKYEHSLRDIIRSITDCAVAALESVPLAPPPTRSLAIKLDEIAATLPSPIEDQAIATAESLEAEAEKLRAVIKGES